ncbi:hypothetical protein WN71_014570 [Streptomyces mangrovisoli]|uniref:Uncharacterized protein n=1 Tax=Streptomyces mangrovisoli TaxID=1428628 RepID=A0A1J4P166_9ACTN|nr:hypothetical protein WN71_014570 [Streptomyces mangrovisoli]
MVIGAAVLLFIASFLNTYDGIDMNSWDNLGDGLGLYLGGVIGAGLIVANRTLPQPRKVAGLDLGTVGTAFTVLVFWIFFWTLVDVPDSVDAASGLILGFIAALVLAGGAVATELVPALKAPLISNAPRPVGPPPFGGQPQGGYGYPGAPQPAFGGGQPQPGPQPGQPFAGQQQPAASDFSPFWFAVPVARPLFPEDGSPTPIAELAPGTWYLAVEQRGAQLVAQTQDGRRGVLQDTSGIQRG